MAQDKAPPAGRILRDIQQHHQLDPGIHTNIGAIHPQSDKPPQTRNRFEPVLETPFIVGTATLGANQKHRSPDLLQRIPTQTVAPQIRTHRRTAQNNMGPNPSPEQTKLQQEKRETTSASTTTAYKRNTTAIMAPLSSPTGGKPWKLSSGTEENNNQHSNGNPDSPKNSKMPAKTLPGKTTTSTRDKSTRTTKPSTSGKPIPETHGRNDRTGALTNEARNGIRTIRLLYRRTGSNGAPPNNQSQRRHKAILRHRQSSPPTGGDRPSPTTNPNNVIQQLFPGIA